MYTNIAHGGCGEVVNTSACGADIRGFDPHQPPFLLGCSQAVRHQTLTLTCVSSNLTEAAKLNLYDLLAQSVEHLTFNQRVMSSNLIQVTICA